MGVAAAAHVVDLAASGSAKECLERCDEVVGVDGVADLLTLVAEDSVGTVFHRAAHQVGEEAVQFGGRRGPVR